MKKLVLNNLLLVLTIFLIGACKEQNKESISSLTTYSRQEASLFPIKDKINEPEKEVIANEVIKSNLNISLVENPQVLENFKKTSLRNIFSSNMPFTENKGQLEKCYDIKIPKIGDIQFYTQAFGGTAYFGKNGIGIGFYTNILDDMYTKNNLTKNYKSKKGKSLFFYINHEGSNDNNYIEGEGIKEAKINYFRGKISEHITDISNYDGVVYKELYNNIDLKYTLSEGHLIYDYIIKPGGKVSEIKRNFDGVNKILISDSEELEIHTDWGILTDKKLFAYQLINGQKKEVKVKYKILSEKSAGFEVIGSYNKSIDLIIDPPTLSFATWVTPGGDNGYIHDLAVDATGNIYASGWINGSNNATLVSPFDNVPPGGEAIVLKLRNDGVSILYASFIGGDGGSGDADIAFGIAVNSSNQVYVAGVVDNATNFPTAGTPIQSTIAGSKDIFVVKINAAGNALIYSTFYGGTGDDRAFDIEVNTSDEAFITGWTTSSASFSTAGAYQTAKGVGGAFGYDAYILKISDPTAGTVVKNYCTYYGGANEDMGRSIAVNGANVFITGVTQSTSSISSVGASFGGGSGGGAFDAFIACINGATGNNRVYGTYVGGDFDEKAEKIAVRSNNHAYITGWTKSIFRAGAGTFPVVNAITGYTQNGNSAGNTRDGFMTHVDATGVILNSTFMGVATDDNLKNGNPFDGLNQHQSSGITVNSSGNVAVVMTTDGGSLPTISSVDATANGGSTGLADNYLFVTDTDAKTLIFTTYFGGDGNDYPAAGVKFDPSDCLIIGGSSHSTTLPVTGGVYDISRNAGTGNDEFYIAKYCTVVLPVDLINFQGKASNDVILINWATASEKNSDYFILEKSTDGINFYPIGKVKSIGNSSDLNNYDFTDTNPSIGVNYYRLRQVDIDGTIDYSAIVEVQYGSELKFSVSPNPGIGLYSIEGILPIDSDVKITVINALGQEIINIKEQKTKGNCILNLNLVEFSSGLYTLKIKAGSYLQTEKLIKQ